ncbi:hypothetical protein KI387_016352, partial [Taxus chinensis]
TPNKLHNNKISLKKEKYSDGRHSDTVVNISASKHKADDRGSIKELQTDDGIRCKYCQTDVENKNMLYPPIKFKVASKNIYGKALPSIVMEINFNSRSKVDRDWRNYIAADYWGFIPHWQHNYNGEIQMPLLPFQ